MPASDTGAVEMFCGRALGARGVDMLAWGVVRRRLGDRRGQAAQAAERAHHHRRLWLSADLKQVNFDNDVVFTWNGTTSGVRVPNGDWIKADRGG